MSQSRSAPNSASLVVRPSFRLVRPFYTCAFALLAICYVINNNRPDPIEWLFVLPVVMLIWAITRHLRQRLISLTIAGGKLRYESGLLSKTTRTMDLAKIQDVSVRQSLLQRILGIGTIEVETAGESGGLAMKDVDRPQSVADLILEQAGR